MKPRTILRLPYVAVRYDSEWLEYVVRTNGAGAAVAGGKFAGSYHTDDRQDAIDSAQAMNAQIAAAVAA